MMTPIMVSFRCDYPNTIPLYVLIPCTLALLLALCILIHLFGHQHLCQLHPIEHYLWSSSGSLSSSALIIVYRNAIGQKSSGSVIFPDVLARLTTKSSSPSTSFSTKLFICLINSQTFLTPSNYWHSTSSPYDFLCANESHVPQALTCSTVVPLIDFILFIQFNL